MNSKIGVFAAALAIWALGCGANDDSTSTLNQPAEDVSPSAGDVDAKPEAAVEAQREELNASGHPVYFRHPPPT